MWQFLAKFVIFWGKLCLKTNLPVNAGISNGKTFLYSPFNTYATTTAFGRTGTCSSGTPKIPIVEATIDGVHSVRMHVNLARNLPWGLEFQNCLA